MFGKRYKFMNYTCNVHTESVADSMAPTAALGKPKLSMLENQKMQAAYQRVKSQIISPK